MAVKTNIMVAKPAPVVETVTRRELVLRLEIPVVIDSGQRPVDVKWRVDTGDEGLSLNASAALRALQNSLVKQGLSDARSHTVRFLAERLGEALLKTMNKMEAV